MASTTDYSAIYAKADQAVKEQYNAAKNAVATAPNNTATDYAALNKKTKDRRNLYAIGNNVAENVGQDSGYVNTNRLRAEAQISGDIAANIKQQAEADAARDLNAQLLGYQADIAANQYLANSALNRADTAEQQAQFNASMDMARQEAQTAQQQYAAEMAYNKAMAELEMFGKITTQEAANVLGLPVGTTSLEWQKYLAALDAASRGGGGGGNNNEYGNTTPNGTINPVLRGEYTNSGAGVVPGALTGNKTTSAMYGNSAKELTGTQANKGVVPGAAGTEIYLNAGMGGGDAVLAAEAYKQNQKGAGRKAGNTGVVPK